MPREREGFRDQYRALTEHFNGREVITLNETCELLGLDRRALLDDKEFPAKKVGKKYIISLVALARWLC